jgi:hypothetical protein
VWAGPFEHLFANVWAGASRWFPGLVLASLIAGADDPARRDRVVGGRVRGRAHRTAILVQSPIAIVANETNARIGPVRVEKLRRSLQMKRSRID